MLKNYIWSHSKKNVRKAFIKKGCFLGGMVIQQEAKNYRSRVQFQLPEFRACMYAQSCLILYDWSITEPGVTK